MNLFQWFVFFIGLQLIHFLATYKLYVKAGYKAWQAVVPVYNAVILMKIIRRSPYWVILLFVPIINLIMFPVVWVELLRNFGRTKPYESYVTVFSLGFYLFLVGHDNQSNYQTEDDLKKQKKTSEWVSSILFAVVAATLVHTYFMQPYAIPTGSLERTLRIGDFLLVSKFHYGARVPMTTVAAPMVHDTLPLARTRSYLKKPQLPYLRLPGFQSVKKNDIVVFSWPADTVRQFFVAEKGVKKPIDKKSNYVKRCVGTPGDTLEIIDGFVHINGKQLQLSDRAKPMYDHTVYARKGVSSRWLEAIEAEGYTRTFRAEQLNQTQYNAMTPYLLGMSQNENYIELVTAAQGIPSSVLRQHRISLKEITTQEREVNLTDQMYQKLIGQEGVDSVIKKLQPKGVLGYNIFPQTPDQYQWNNDQLGPLFIPKRGSSIALNEKTYPLYKKIIREYEHNTLSKEGDSFLLNGEKATSYTFKMDYYWMMGDNRHHSEDSRTWGFVPEDHIVGKPVFIWMSWDNFNQGLFSWKGRWDRFFTTVNGKGEPVSYFWAFIFALGLYYLYSKFVHRKFFEYLKSKTNK